MAGQEVVWLSETLRILREEAPAVDVTITTKSSPELANALMQGEMDVALLRRETRTASLEFKFLVKKPLVATLPSRHRLARHRTVRPDDICHEDLISTARAAPVLKTVIEAYAAKVGIKLNQIYEAEALSGGMSQWLPPVASHCCQSMCKMRSFLGSHSASPRRGSDS